MKPRAVTPRNGVCPGCGSGACCGPWDSVSPCCRLGPGNLHGPGVYGCPRSLLCEPENSYVCFQVGSGSGTVCVWGWVKGVRPGWMGPSWGLEVAEEPVVLQAERRAHCSDGKAFPREERSQPPCLRHWLWWAGAATSVAVFRQPSPRDNVVISTGWDVGMPRTSRSELNPL